MKVRIELDSTLDENEIILKCSKADAGIKQIENFISSVYPSQKIRFFRDNEEFYLPLDDILFFETEGDTLYAHTDTSSYEVRYRLYELEAILPDYFIRISKSSIVNTRHILSVTKNITSSSLIKFSGSSKQIYVSRLYYKNLHLKLTESRL